MFEIEPYNLINSEYDISINTAKNEVKIVLFSDTHYKNDDISPKELVKLINKQNPELVFFVGDLIDDYQNNPVDTDDIIKYFTDIDAKYGKFAIMGNHDYGGYADKIYKEIMNESGFELLINEALEIDSLNLNIIGLDDLLLGDILDDISHLKKDDMTNILLLHEGDEVDLHLENYDFAFSGHSHGGQINLPIIKDYVLPLGAEKYVQGYYENVNLITTSGIGTTKIHARLFVPPEIITINFKY